MFDLNLFRIWGLGFGLWVALPDESSHWSLLQYFLVDLKKPGWVKTDGMRYVPLAVFSSSVSVCFAHQFGDRGLVVSPTLTDLCRVARKST